MNSQLQNNNNQSTTPAQLQNAGSLRQNVSNIGQNATDNAFVDVQLYIDLLEGIDFPEAQSVENSLSQDTFLYTDLFDGIGLLTEPQEDLYTDLFEGIGLTEEQVDLYTSLFEGIDFFADVENTSSQNDQFSFISGNSFP
ncbi:2223_t:CDS:1 [Dentiscutata erythropus]|uniref:2223_t:CDS:1 n=1 Tax=Dentiscutata erythropus TaxID=1348616 RepID=A0A9N9HBV8_9GLOM|nr:2223_t:CDS:1 [Dentiscutata erythropus]